MDEAGAGCVRTLSPGLVVCLLGHTPRSFMWPTPSF